MSTNYVISLWLTCWCSLGMGSGSAGKEGGPLKALLRQQTQSALEQRVRNSLNPVIYLMYTSTVHV